MCIAFMKFEEQITILCARALAENDDLQVQRVLAELRLLLHEHIEQLRSELAVAYTKSLVKPFSTEGTRNLSDLIPGQSEAALAQNESKRWQQVVHEIACATDRGSALELSQELSRLLQRNAPRRMP